MRISDWSSDVCSSDLQGLATCSFFLAADVDQLTLFWHDFQFIKLNGCKSQHLTGAWMTYGFRSEAAVGPGQQHIKHNAQQGGIPLTQGLFECRRQVCSQTGVGIALFGTHQIGRASCRERVCQYV